jgi:NAD-dependent dihydropyrimidine dehydrogenase PreA subunit
VFQASVFGSELRHRFLGVVSSVLNEMFGMYFPKIDRSKCKNHGECLKICPEDVFDLDSKGVRVARPGDCTKCEACVVVCPAQAIQVEEM